MSKFRLSDVDLLDNEYSHELLDLLKKRIQYEGYSYIESVVKSKLGGQFIQFFIRYYMLMKKYVQFS